jgi:hypothetical protein
MHEARSKVLKDILEKPEAGASEQPYTKERQLTAQSFNLHVERKDGRQTEGFAWSHYVGYRWTDEGERERLVVIFGSRAIEIEGHNLGVLVGEIREGQLSSVRELVSRQATLLGAAQTDGVPIISSVKTYPDFEEILNEIKGENDDKPGHARRASGR